MPDKTRNAEIRKTAELNAHIQTVWSAITSTEGLSAWFMPSTIKPELGCQFTIDAGQYGVSNCKVIELDPPNRLSFTWGEEGWVVTFELTELGEKTQVTMIHSGWNERTSPFQNQMDQGWEELVNSRLRTFVES